MIGLILIGVFGLWVWLAVYLGLQIPKWLNLKRRWPVTVVVVSLLVCMPFVDELIGRHQFKQLCKKYATVQSATPNQKYEALMLSSAVNIELTGVIKPTQISISYFADLDGKKLIRSETTVSQKDQWILRGLGLGGNSYCEASAIEELTPQDKSLRLNRYMQSNRQDFVIETIKSPIGQLKTVLEKLEFNKK